MTQSIQPLCELGTIFDHNRPHIELKQCLMPFKAISIYLLKVAAKRGEYSLEQMRYQAKDRYGESLFALEKSHS